MSRLADYFVVVGYDRTKERGGVSNGMIVQRFPAIDWPDTPFIEGIEWFCQPQGWALSTERQEPKFFVSVLTDIDANRHYCACLCFNETVSISPTKPADEEEDSLDQGSLGRGIPPPISHHSIMYAPKCLVLVSRLDYIETFRSCLGTIYTVYIENITVPLETLVGNILGCVQVPPPGGPQVRFSIGAGDRQALQPPLSPTLPVTHTAVSLLFQTLGIRNVVVLFCAIMTEQKILFHSASYTRLTEACRALTSLMYPFKYTHVFIPLLPAALIEVLSTPTPFVMGVHSSLKHDVADLMDVIVADIDGGAIMVPDSVSLALLPEPLLSLTNDSLSAILQPELTCADHAFPPVALRTAQPALQDKELRAVFLRTFAQLMQGYRCCLTIIRIHPKPVITFHKSAFLGERGLTDCEFVQRVLDCMFFTGFVAERGPSWRPCDVWDEVYSGMPDLLRTEAQDPRRSIKHIQELGQQLYVNENPNSQPYVQKILRPPEGAFARIHQPSLPVIDHDKVQAIIDEGMAKTNLKARLSSLRPAQPRIVPNGPTVSNAIDNRLTVSDSARRLEVLRQCVCCIFENKISDARKAFPAVVRALKSKTARLALCSELSLHVVGNKAMLEHQQFDLVVRLMNCALQDDSVMDEHGVAAALLPLATAFCRKLCTGVIQFAYTCIQEHPVWQNQQFWEAAFYQDVQRDIKALYLPRSGGDHTPSSPRELNEFPYRNFSRLSEPSALEIAAEQMRLWNTYDTSKQAELVSSEESTLYSQAIHFANRMVYLLIPLDVCGRMHREAPGPQDEERISVTNTSVAESDSADAESGFEETDPGETGTAVIKTVSRFVDKVCTESGVSAEHVRSLHQMIPGVVHMHMETLDSVFKESKRLPPIQKPKILLPNLLQGEELEFDGLRAYILADGRDEVTGGVFGGPPLLPAEGALFITNYRIIFKGTPCDPFACEQPVVRAFPVTSLTKEKRISSPQYLAHLDQFLSEGLQIRSCCFQLVKLAFDEEVSGEALELFRKTMQRVRHPPTVLHHFAFTGQLIVAPTAGNKGKEKNATLKGFAKKTLLKTARKAGFKPKTSSKRQKYVLPNIAGSKYLTSPGRMSLPSSELNFDDDASVDDFEVNGPMILAPPSTDAKTLERLSERSYVKDWQRLGLTGGASPGARPPKANTFRLTHVNAGYGLCHSYPALLVIPACVDDSSMRRIAQGYRHNRFPAVTWRHTRTKALLVRGAKSLTKGVIGMLKGHPTSNTSNSEATSSVEQEKYISELVLITPMTAQRQGEPWAMSSSNLSIDSLVLTAAEEHMPALTTPETNRRTNPFNKAMGTLGVLPRSSGGKGPKPIGRWGSLKDRRQSSSQSSLAGGGGTGAAANRVSARYADCEPSGDPVHTFQRAALYIFGEKAHMRGMKTETFPKTDYIPVDYYDVKSSKTSFKKLMRACVPSSVSIEPEHSFHRLVESSEWLQQIQNMMQLAGAVVDLMDLQGSSVLISLEDGWDITAQISSIAQLCLDPHYRTIEGFRVLIEKEWLAFGHRFSHRSNLSEHAPTAGFAPTFLQFLDVVHQVMRQFPLAFEFNDFYLRFLAYHSVSCRFRTFLLDCELERVECGITAVEDKRGSLTTHHKGVDTGGSDDEGVYPGGRLAGTSQGQNLGQSVFDYIEKQHSRSPLFYNFLFSPETDNMVLRPSSRIPNLDIWDYYLIEDLAHGPPYDLEVQQMDFQQDEESEAADGGGRASRKGVIAGYDNVTKLIPDAFTRLLDDMHRLETELGHLPQKWKVLWDKLELPNTDSLTRNASFSTQLVRYHGRLQHKRSTLEILLRGKLSGAAERESSHVFSHPHRFEKVNYNFTTPIHCDYCNNLLWGPVQTGRKCIDCSYNCHDKCYEQVPDHCTKYKTAVDANQSTTLTRSSDAASCNSSVSNMQASNHHSGYVYEQFNSNVAENRTHEGYLYKRGNLLKGWKQRWFVLDSIKHQLRYYDAMEDCNSKGYIDLGEVMSVTTGVSDPRMPKKADDKCLIELRTSRRTYNFCANDSATAQEWMDKIQSCLQ